jgi:hypothetical protein
VHAGRSPEELAQEFEPTAQSIRNWAGQAECGQGGVDRGARNRSMSDSLIGAFSTKQ